MNRLKHLGISSDRWRFTEHTLTRYTISTPPFSFLFGRRTKDRAVPTLKLIYLDEALYEEVKLW